MMLPLSALWARASTQENEASARQLLNAESETETLNRQRRERNRQLSEASASSIQAQYVL